MVIGNPAPSTADDGDRRVMLCGEVVPEPGHVCAFFDSQAQKYETLTPFLSDAVAAGDKIINIVDAIHRDAHIDKLAEADIAVADAISRRQLQIKTSEETYLQDGITNLDALLDFLGDTLATAQNDGQSVRTWGEMNWISRSGLPIKTVLAYEARVNHLLNSHQCTLLCVYDLAATPSSLVSDILATHPFAIIKGRLRPNPFFVQPEEYLHMLDSDPNLSSAF